MRKLDPNRNLVPEDFTLIDDGSLDTVVELPNGETWRYAEAIDYRDPDTGELDFDLWVLDRVIPDVEADPDIWKS